MKIITIKELVSQSVQKYGDGIAYQMKSEETGQYRRISYKQVGELVKKVQGALLKLGITKGERVILISESRPEWTISYLAIASMGAINVPLDSMQKKEEILPLLEDSGAKAIVLSRKYEEYAKGTSVQGKELFMEDIENLPAPSSLPETEVGLEDVAAIVYTSGTTGIPKGVMLSHQNIMYDVISCASLFDLSPKDNFLMVLPLHHTFETTAGFLIPFFNGCRKTFPETLKSHAIIQNMSDTGVTVLGSVPLFFKLLYEGIWRGLEEKKVKWLFSFLLLVSKFFKFGLGINIGKFLFAPIHKKLGGKLWFSIVGGAPFPPEFSRNFDAMGFIVLQGYGLTESAPILSLETLKFRRTGSVGKPPPGVELKTAGTEAEGEILAFGPNIMKGYYKRDDLTAGIIKNGWLHTGDLGRIDEDGYVFITGRSKDIIVTPAGVNVYPDEIEHILDKTHPIKESCVLGVKVKEGTRKGMEEVVAVIVPDLEYFEKIGNKDEKFIKETITKEVEDFNKKVAAFKRIARFIIRKEEIPRTRLMKIKRFKVRKEMNLGG